MDYGSGVDWTLTLGNDDITKLDKYMAFLKAPPSTLVLSRAAFNSGFHNRTGFKMLSFLKDVRYINNFT